MIFFFLARIISSEMFNLDFNTSEKYVYNLVLLAFRLAIYGFYVYHKSKHNKSNGNKNHLFQMFFRSRNCHSIPWKKKEIVKWVFAMVIFLFSFQCIKVPQTWQLKSHGFMIFDCYHGCMLECLLLSVNIKYHQNDHFM